MASGGGEQSSREGCGEECRRQTISPPDPDATLRSMTSRSTVTRPVSRHVAKDYTVVKHFTPSRKGYVPTVPSLQLTPLGAFGASIFRLSALDVPPPALK